MFAGGIYPKRDVLGCKDFANISGNFLNSKSCNNMSMVQKKSSFVLAHKYLNTLKILFNIIED